MNHFKAIRRQNIIIIIIIMKCNINRLLFPMAHPTDYKMIRF